MQKHKSLTFNNPEEPHLIHDAAAVVMTTQPLKNMSMQHLIMSLAVISSGGEKTG